MLVKGIIKDKQYELLIKYAFQKSDAVMFVLRKDGFTNDQKLQLDMNAKVFKKRLNHSFLKSRNGSYWVFTKVGYSQLNIAEYKDSSDFDNLFEILFYKTNKEVEEYLLTNKNLYTWLNPKYPEDVSFFKNGYCWLYSVAHEELCDIYCENEEEYNYLKSIGIEFVDNKFVKTLDNDLYFESYNIIAENNDIQI